MGQAPMELRRIELPSSACKADVLPLNDSPNEDGRDRTCVLCRVKAALLPLSYILQEPKQLLVFDGGDIFLTR